jgi:hypothetical protein
MHDVFAAELAETGEKYGLTRVPVTIVEKPGQAKGFTFARSTEPWVFKGSVHGVIDVERDARKDGLHHRSSGLDTTSAKQCARSGVVYVINLANLRSLDPVVHGRVMQNIALCRKHGAAIAVVSNAQTEGDLPNELDVRSLLVTLGLPAGEAKQATHELAAAYKRFQAN